MELETSDHRCILFREPVTGRPFAWEFHQRRKKVTVKPQGMLTVNDPGTVYSTCLAGLGIAQLFELGIEEYTSSRQLVQLFPDWSEQRFPLYAYYRRDIMFPQRLVRFLISSQAWFADRNGLGLHQE